MLNHAVVIATRNRVDALEISIPLVLAQSRPAARVVVVDKSDDHAAVVALCASLAASTAIPLTVVEPPQANLAHQRNVGLAEIEEDVVMFPDDDAFWYPDTAAEVMRVYEADEHGLIGGVSAVQTDASPVAPGKGSASRRAGSRTCRGSFGPATPSSRVWFRNRCTSTASSGCANWRQPPNAPVCDSPSSRR
jgi:hypothetical protein